MDFIVPKFIEEYAAAHTTPHSRLLEELEEYTIANCTNPQMLVGRIEGALLRLLVQMTGARRVLEIGTFTGYSALCMAEGLRKTGRIITCEVSSDHADIAQSFFERSVHGKKIEIRRGPALETLQTLPAEPVFDLVFLDADKENYLNYYEAVLPRLKSGGLIAADNVLWSGNVLNPKKETDYALVRFNETVQQDPRVENVMLTVRDGVSLIRKIDLPA